MADPLIITMLTTKRAEITRAIRDLEHQAHQHHESLKHIDATLRLFDPNVVPELARTPGRSQQGGPFSAGDISGACMDAIREADGASIRSREIALRLMAEKGMNAADTKLRNSVLTRVRAALGAFQRRGVMESVGQGWDTRWKLAGPA